MLLGPYVRFVYLGSLVHIKFANAEELNAFCSHAHHKLSENIDIRISKGINIDWSLGSALQVVDCKELTAMVHRNQCVSSVSANRRACRFLIASWVDAL